MAPLVETLLARARRNLDAGGLGEAKLQLVRAQRKAKGKWKRRIGEVLVQL